MSNLSKFFKAINYRISNGTEVQDGQYGHNAFVIDSYSNPLNNWSVSCIFDTQNQDVYEISACDYNADLAYRWIREDLRKQIKRREYDVIAWDDVEYINLCSIDEILEKVSRLSQDQTLDQSTEVTLKIGKNVYHHLMETARRRDITFNQIVNEILTETLDIPQ